LPEKTPCGLVMVYTGDGKGKTTAAMGLALRAVGHGQKVYIIHFMKGRDYGEFLASRYLPGMTVEKGGRDEFVNPQNPDPLDLEMAQKAFRKGEKAVLSKKYQMVVFDEIIVAVDYGLLPLDDLLSLIKRKPPEVDLVLTGRGAPRALIEVADMVSEIKEIKHHFRKGIGCRRGIEY
jgi:cob(I)alamin adenosyltransferase